MIKRTFCPTCRTPDKFNVDERHELDKKLPALHLALDVCRITLTAQQSEEVSALERLFPLPGSQGDGTELVIEPEWDPDNRMKVHLHMSRRVKPGAPAAPAVAEKSLEDLQTEAAMAGLKIEPKWNKAQVAKALAEHESRKGK